MGLAIRYLFDVDIVVISALYNSFLFLIMLGQPPMKTRQGGHNKNAGKVTMERKMAVLAFLYQSSNEVTRVGHERLRGAWRRDTGGSIRYKRTAERVKSNEGAAFIGRLVLLCPHRT